MGRVRLRFALPVMLVTLAACTGGGPGAVITAGAASPAGAAPPRLTGPHPCPGAAGFTCSVLTVPLDHSGRVRGRLRLQVAAANNVHAPHGVLLLLTGGPGQPGVPFVSRLAARLAPVLHAYRLVMFDQRGTGRLGAIGCRALQAAVGSSDIAVPPAAAVRQCAASLGPDRRFYSTADTVADIDLLRAALGARTITLDGVSYGTFVAQRYALAHRGRVAKLVLDSVLPQAEAEGGLAFYLAGLRAVARVLRLACRAAPACGFDPAQDVAWLVRHGVNGVRLFGMLVADEFTDPTYRNPRPAGVPPRMGGVIGALHAARLGHPARLNRLLRSLTEAGGPPAMFSSGLHAAALCTDLRFPWGSDAVPPARRPVALRRAAARLTTAQVWPFDAATAAGNGIMQTCLDWPATPAAPEPPASARLPAVPVLLLAGDHDLSTPLEWARQEMALAPRSRLVVVPGAAHSIQSREPGHQGRDALFAFLLH